MIYKEDGDLGSQDSKLSANNNLTWLCINYDTISRIAKQYLQILNGYLLMSQYVQFPADISWFPELQNIKRMLMISI